MDMAKSESTDRTALLEHNKESVIKAMKERGLSDPVGVIVDTSDMKRRRFFKSALVKSGKLDPEAVPRMVAIEIYSATRRKFLTGILVVNWKVAEGLLHRTSPTVADQLERMRPQCQPGTGQHLIVTVGSGGIEYGVVAGDEPPRQSQPVTDSLHRVDF